MLPVIAQLPKQDAEFVVDVLTRLQLRKGQLMAYDGLFLSVLRRVSRWPVEVAVMEIKMKSLELAERSGSTEDDCNIRIASVIALIRDHHPEAGAAVSAYVDQINARIQRLHAANPHSRVHPWLKEPCALMIPPRREPVADEAVADV